MTKQPINLRNAVLSMLLETAKGEKSHIVLKHYLDQHGDLEKQERAFITRLFEGTIERQIELDYIINQISKTKTKKMKPVILQILRMSVYQLKYMDSVPEFAVCNEAVKLAGKRGFGTLKGFINGVLRNVAKQMDTLELPKEELERLSVQYSVPKWMLELWKQDFGMEQVREILEHLYEERQTTLRIQLSARSGDKETCIEAVKDSLKAESVTVTDTILPNVIRISDYDSLGRLSAFRNGWVVVQDLSSVLASVVAAPKKGAQVIDVCAAPGGKSLCVADLLENTGIVEARDLTEKKVQLINENIQRTGMKNVTAKVADATRLDEASVENADVVIADLPCSGLGVIANKSDIKYNVSLEQIEELSKLQREILKVVSKYVKPGGTLVYSTCTVNKKENEENALWIEKELGFMPKEFPENFPKELLADRNTNQLQIFPGELGMDGFFISLFQK